jgi:hypothetical protein
MDNLNVDETEGNIEGMIDGMDNFNVDETGDHIESVVDLLPGLAALAFSA